MPDETRALIERAKELDKAAPNGPWFECKRDDTAGCVCGLVWSVEADWPAVQVAPDESGEGWTPAAKLAIARLVAEYRTLAPQLAVELEQALARLDAARPTVESPILVSVQEAKNLLQINAKHGELRTPVCALVPVAGGEAE